jgi:hypothetical protein
MVVFKSLEIEFGIEELIFVGDCRMQIIHHFEKDDD